MKVELTRSMLFARQCIDSEIRRSTPREWGRPLLKDNPEWISQNIISDRDQEGVYTVSVTGVLNLQTVKRAEHLTADVTAVVKKTFGLWFALRISGSLNSVRMTMRQTGDAPTAACPLLTISVGRQG